MLKKAQAISLEEAVSRLLTNINPLLSTEAVPLDEALGRVAASDICAPFDQPPFARSPLDGYALRAEDTVGACTEAPAVLTVVGETFAGMPPHLPIRPGQAVRIMTGAPIPAGADCVVRQEDTNCTGDTVRVYADLDPFQNYCFQGEDIREGTCVIRRGTVLDFATIGVLALLGQARISVVPRPRIGVLATGDELTEVGLPLAPGKIYNSNQHLLCARLRELGALPIALSQCPDSPEVIARHIDETLKDCDLVITTGGVSVGERDFLPEVCRILGGKLLFHGVSMKPGSPAMAFLHRGKPVLCLSGNPFAVAATFELLARPMLAALCSCPSTLPRTTGVLQDAFSKVSKRRRFLRARMIGGKVYLPRGNAEVHSSGALCSMLNCNCMVDIPAGTPQLVPGQMVEVVLL